MTNISVRERSLALDQLTHALRDLLLVVDVRDVQRSMVICGCQT